MAAGITFVSALLTALSPLSPWSQDTNIDVYRYQAGVVNFLPSNRHDLPLDQGGNLPVENKTCFEKKETGPCNDSLPHFFYDPESESCKPFVYGGCGGNGNRFETKQLCQKYCKDSLMVDDQDECELDPEPGPCQARKHRYYFNKETGKCETFYYGGCQGNDNRFKTEDECERRCLDESFKCPAERGCYQYPKDCHKYYECENGKLAIKRCLGGLEFDAEFGCVLQSFTCNSVGGNSLRSIMKE